jgi:TRAP-type C4-dicarboxylate transport system permease small subunit
MYKKYFISLFISMLVLGGMFLTMTVLAADFGLGKTAENAGYDLAKTNPADTVQLIVSVVLGFAAMVFFGLALYGGFIWMLARGNEEKVTSAKAILEAAVIGIIIVSASYAISRFVLSRLTGGDVSEVGCCVVASERTEGVTKEKCDAQTGTWAQGVCQN